MCFHRTGSGVDQTSNVTQFEEGEDLAALKVPESVSEKTNRLLYEKAYYEQNQPVQHVVSCGDSVPCALEGWPWSSISTSQDGAHHPLREIILTLTSLHLGKLLLCGVKTY